MAVTLSLILLALVCAWLFQMITKKLSFGARLAYEGLYAECSRLIQINASFAQA